jgi:hypothetical protein
MRHLLQAELVCTDHARQKGIARPSVPGYLLSDGWLLQDFFYVCPVHLKDRYFCTPKIDEAAVKAKKDKEWEEEKEKLKKEYEEKQRKKKEKEKEKDKDKEKDKNKDKDEKKDEKQEGDESAEVRNAWRPQFPVS